MKSASVIVIVVGIGWFASPAAADGPGTWAPFSAARAAAAKQGYNRYLASCAKRRQPPGVCRCLAYKYAFALLSGGHRPIDRECTQVNYDHFRIAVRNALAGKTAQALGLLGKIVVAGSPGPGVRGSATTQALGEAVKGGQAASGVR